ncbi:MAG: nucleotidyl transferase AbiEii/AbiGii toxin family protein [Candidatus Micrarchaeota archaeon]|nr:nucleotidyl transferase AbiEii/AbiGii toxin family protein [Candidatus Micrarchaeota archaeon]MBU1886746.1 nucleotidyl transferase AbiEii/AbiGii toxin family protein [Candidatus Micrarchaeota archaeon]
MLGRTELIKYGPPGFHPAQQEKDYVQHWVLSYLSQSGQGGIFKGGTALQKAYQLPRYSEDLDFTINNSPIPDYDAISAFLSSAGFSGIVWKRDSKEISEVAKIRLNGPLYNGKEISECVVTLEFSKREKTSLPPTIITVTPPYPDLLPYSICVMNPDEIVAEKIRAILTRNSARDLYDLYFLLHKNANINFELVDKKLEYYNISFQKTQFETSVQKLQKIWKTEISSLTTNMLEYSTVAKVVLAHCKDGK